MSDAKVVVLKTFFTTEGNADKCYRQGSEYAVTDPAVKANPHFFTEAPKPTKATRARKAK